MKNSETIGGEINENEYFSNAKGKGKPRSENMWQAAVLLNLRPKFNPKGQSYVPKNIASQLFSNQRVLFNFSTSDLSNLNQIIDKMAISAITTKLAIFGLNINAIKANPRLIKLEGSLLNIGVGG